MARSTTIALKPGWKRTLSSATLRTQIITCTLLMLSLSFMLPSFFNTIQKRRGVVLQDWVLEHIQPHNVSVIIFLIIWSIIGLLLVRVIKTPAIYNNYVWVFLFICIARVITISLIPLAPPVGLIPLTDPLTSVFYGESNITKDLFFSGHTAIVFLAFLCLEKKWDKIFALVATFAVGTLLLVQHVHYTVDVLASPPIVYVLFKSVKFWIK